MNEPEPVCSRCGQPLYDSRVRLDFAELPPESLPPELALCRHCFHSLRHWYGKGRKRFGRGAGRESSRSGKRLESGEPESNLLARLLIQGGLLTAVIVATALVTAWLLKPAP